MLRAGALAVPTPITSAVPERAAARYYLRSQHPETLQDLTDPTYQDLFVTPGATSSSPGLAFLLATVGVCWLWWRLLGKGPVERLMALVTDRIG